MYEHIAQELITRLAIPVNYLSSGLEFLAVADLYLQDPRNRVDELHHEILAIMRQRFWPTPKPLRQLAEIRHFQLFVSVTFDTLLSQALDEVRFHGAKRTQTIAYSEKSHLEDLPANLESLSQTAVFQLFGKLEATGDYGVTEDKILEFSHRLQSHDFRPKNLFDALRDSSLLVVGCNFPGWLARFLLRASKGDQLFTQGARGLVADRTSKLDPAFVMFLERRRTALYTQGDAVQFVAELHDRWTAQFGRAVVLATPPRYPDPRRGSDFQLDSVFISYASDDREHAIRIKEAFDEAGVDAWFDQDDIRSGDDFRLRIERTIENCSYFVPLISVHTAQAGKRFFWREWNKAIDEEKAYPPEYPFIQPILLDDTPFRNSAAITIGN